MVSLTYELLEHQLVIVIAELYSVYDMDVFVKLNFGVDQRQVCYHVVLVQTVFLQELILGLEHLLDVLVVEQDLRLGHRFFKGLVKFEMALDNQGLWLNVMHPLGELTNYFVEVLVLFLFNEGNSHHIASSCATHCQE